MRPSVVPSGGTADSRRHHPSRGDPPDPPPSAARGRPAAACPGSCSPSKVRLGRFSGLGGDVRAVKGCFTPLSVCNPVCISPPRISQPPVPRPSPQGTPEALPYPILRRLSSTSQSRAAPRYAMLRAARAGCRGALGTPHEPARRGRRRGALGAPGGGLPRHRGKNTVCFSSPPPAVEMATGETAGVPEPEDTDAVEWRRRAVLRCVCTASVPSRPGDIAKQLGLSSPTVRHDLEYWRKQGRVNHDEHGG